MTCNSFLFLKAPRWHTNVPGSRYYLPAAMQSWVFEPGSITGRLRRLYGKDVSVTILFNQWRRPFLSEQRELCLPSYLYCLNREVLLHVKGRPLVLARTIIPAQTLKIAHCQLAKLGTRPLGEVIFSYPLLQRNTVALSQIPVSNWHPAALEKGEINQTTTGRRTVYRIVGKPLIVSEFFLPELFLEPL